MCHNCVYFMQLIYTIQPTDCTLLIFCDRWFSPDAYLPIWKLFLITIFLYVKFLYWQFLITSLIFFLPTPYLFLPPCFFLGIWFSLISIVIICIYCSVLSSCNPPPRKTLIVYVFCVQCFRLSLFSFCFFFLYYFMTHIC